MNANSLRHQSRFVALFLILALTFCFPLSSLFAGDHGETPVAEHHGEAPEHQAVEQHGEEAQTEAHGGGHGGGHGEEQGFGEIVLHHLTDITAIELPSFKTVTTSIPLDGLKFEVAGIDMSITKPVIFMWLAVLLLILMFTTSFRGGKLMNNKFAHLLEIYILFIRDEVVYPNIGEKDGRRLLPFFLTLFFFILMCNLLGLIPWGSTATANVNVTAGLAIIAFLAIQGLGIKQNGFAGHFKALVPSGLPAFVIPIMIPVELVGMIAKPFALCIRLFANMVAGHAVIIVLLMLIIQAGSYVIAPLPILGVLFISMLELFVAHLQAFIFTILTTLFISMSLHPSH